MGDSKKGFKGMSLTDSGNEIMRLLTEHLKDLLSDPSKRANLKAADLEMIRKFLADQSITLASVQRGDFGDVVKSAAEQFPFAGDDDGAPRFTN